MLLQEKLLEAISWEELIYSESTPEKLFYSRKKLIYYRKSQSTEKSIYSTGLGSQIDFLFNPLKDFAFATGKNRKNSPARFARRVYFLKDFAFAAR